MRSPARAGLLLVAAGLLVPLLGSCARQEPPPGAIQESQPPEISELYPPRDTVLPELDGAARVEFDEPISRPGNLRGELRASPAYRYRVSAGHHGVEVEPEGGWRPGAVYVLELTARISDLLNNQRDEPIRWRFSTGPPVTETRVTGTLWDRVTGQQIREGRAHFLPVEGDSIPYAAIPDSGGIFALEAVPPGGYRAVGFVDRNRNLTPDELLEPTDTTRFQLEDPSDRVRLQLVLVEPDSTPPVLGRVEPRDSVTVRLTFDDYLLPAQQLGTGSVTLRPMNRAEEWPLDSVRVLTPEDTVAARTDATTGRPGPTTAPGDTAAPPSDTVASFDDTVTAPADTAALQGDTAAAAPADTVPPISGRDGAQAADTTPSPVETLPTRSLRIRLAEPMVRDTYRIQVRGIQNLRRLAGAGDTTFVYAPVDTAAADTAAAPGDTTAAPADTGASRDTASRADSAVASDSVSVDGAGAAGDTTTAGDTTAAAGTALAGRPRRSPPRRRARDRRLR